MCFRFARLKLKMQLNEFRAWKEWKEVWLSIKMVITTICLQWSFLYLYCSHLCLVSIVFCKHILIVGVCVRATNIPPASVTHYCALLHMLVKKAKSSIRELDQTNDLTFIRVRTRTNEIMIAPGISGFFQRYSLLCSYCFFMFHFWCALLKASWLCYTM